MVSLETGLPLTQQDMTAPNTAMLLIIFIISNIITKNKKGAKKNGTPKNSMGL